MRYNAIQVEYLAAEYVLGTLQGAARRRFDRLVTDRADVRFALWRWERHLNGFAGGLESRKPSSRVWKGIERRIDSSKHSRAASRGWWSGAWLALPAAVAAAWLAAVFYPAPTADERIAVFADQNSATLWVISADLDNRVLQTRAVNVTPPTGGASYELWVLPAAGAPQSLGLLPITTGSFTTEISPRLVSVLANARRLAISIEPAGGSPTGLPTGPVVHQASLITT